MKVINLYGGPGTGKSTCAAGLFAELKLMGINCELVTEYAKDKVWEFGTSGGNRKLFAAQEYIFGKQHFRLRRLRGEVDVVVTDCPLLLSLIYTPSDFDLPSMRNVVREAYRLYDNMDVFLVRNKPYVAAGRFQTEEKARELDTQVKAMLNVECIQYETVVAGRDAVSDIVALLIL